MTQSVNVNTRKELWGGKRAEQQHPVNKGLLATTGWQSAHQRARRWLQTAVPPIGTWRSQGGNQQTCRTAGAELPPPTAESGFNGDRNVTLLASTSLSGCRQRWVAAAEAGRAAVKPANAPKNSLRWRVTAW